MKRFNFMMSEKVWKQIEKESKDLGIPVSGFSRMLIKQFREGRLRQKKSTSQKLINETS